jgi:hypothetical protein
MAWGRLSGYRRIDELDEHDVEDEPGVYLFYRRIDGPVRYVGRSDTSLYGRIRYRDYVYYRYKHCADEEEAYHWECMYFHHHRDTIDNRNHPAKPWYSDSACPVCGR